MNVGKVLQSSRFSTIDPAVAVALPIAVAPFGYLVGYLFVVHLVASEAEAVWLTTVVATTLAFLGYSLAFDTDSGPDR
ncbi:hypothetical protein [Haloprofundus halobius]|uniref:hypothetical protein n=1 Tax=Haloprofundus halobius TaxID=2876194 RepID=UPI001CCF0FEE|nr:hypothetical protein [Haloprofundus halobius]